MITIAHRLSTVKNSDLVIYLEKGKIIALGTFDQVRRQVPNFEKQANLMGISAQH
jgi:ABC-type multidrug transport system fused ATPase/permease subunit